MFGQFPGSNAFVGQAHSPIVRALVVLLLPLMSLSGCLGDVLGGGIDPKDIVSDDTYDHWIIEIDYMEGHRPSSSAVNLIKDRLGTIVSKATIDVRIDDALPATGGAYSTRDLQRLTDNHLDAKTSGNTVVTHVIYLDGHSSSDTSNGKVLGVALGDHQTVGIFHETIRSQTAGLVSLYTTTQVERVVLLHEMGHIIGLVDNGLKMQTNHEDPEHQGHSNNENSVMYWAVESSDLFQFFQGGLPDTFDANDKRDVCAAGGKGTC